MDKSFIIPIVGLSPRNAYYNAENIGFVLEETITTYGRVIVMVADIPDIQNQLAFGYSPDRARGEADEDGRELKGRVKAYCDKRGYSYTERKESHAQVNIIDWARDIDGHAVYEQKKSDILTLYETNTSFREDIHQTTSDVLRRRMATNEKTKRHIKKLGTGNVQKGLDHAVDLAKHYILCELAFLNAAPAILGGQFVQYIYHREWPVYEKYISNKFDTSTHSNLGFHVTDHMIPQAPSPLSPDILRVAYSDYPPGMYRDSNGEYKGIFYDLLKRISADCGRQFEIVREVGYDMAVRGLNEGDYDIFCSPTWETECRRLKANLTDPIYTSDVGLWVNTQHPLARHGLEGLKDDQIASEFTLATKTYDVTDHYADRFPQARRINTPVNTAIMGLLERVAQGRAVGTFVEPPLTRWCMKNRQLDRAIVNVGTIDVATNHFMLAPGQRGEELVVMFNDALKNLRQEGFIHDRIKAHTGRDDTFGFNLPTFGGGRRPILSTRLCH
jgi:tRNA-dependent cyclodipeptide synthase